VANYGWQTEPSGTLIIPKKNFRYFHNKNHALNQSVRIFVSLPIALNLVNSRPCGTLWPACGILVKLNAWHAAQSVVHYET